MSLTIGATITARVLSQHAGAVMKHVRETGQPVTVTNNGIPTVVINPAAPHDDPIQRLIDAGLATPAKRAHTPLPKEWPLPTRSGLSVEELLTEMEEDH